MNTEVKLYVSVPTEVELDELSSEGEKPELTNVELEGDELLKVVEKLVNSEVKLYIIVSKEVEIGDLSSEDEELGLSNVELEGEELLKDVE